MSSRVYRECVTIVAWRSEEVGTYRIRTTANVADDTKIAKGTKCAKGAHQQATKLSFVRIERTEVGRDEDVVEVYCDSETDHCPQNDGNYIGIHQL